jgi:hypothetical protein
VTGQCAVSEYGKKRPSRPRGLKLRKICGPQPGDDFFRSFHILFVPADNLVYGNPRLSQSAVTGFQSLRVSLPEFADNGCAVITDIWHFTTIVRVPGE